MLSFNVCIKFLNILECLLIVLYSMLANVSLHLLNLFLNLMNRVYSTYLFNRKLFNSLTYKLLLLETTCCKAMVCKNIFYDILKY